MQNDLFPAPIDDVMRSLVRALGADRPLVVLDVEATGPMAQHDRIVQIGWVRVEPAEPHAVTSQMRLVNPERPIPAETTEIHGITDADVAAEPTFQSIAAELAAALAGVDFVGYNFEFDRQMLEQEFARADVQHPFGQARVIDPYRIWLSQEPRGLSSAVRHFCDFEPEVAHRALEDAEHTARVLEAQLRRYAELDASVQSLHDLCNRRGDWVDDQGKIVWRNGAARINFGKHRGIALKDLDPGYLDWMLDPKRDFAADVRQIIDRAKRGEYPTEPART